MVGNWMKGVKRYKPQLSKSWKVKHNRMMIVYMSVWHI